MSISFENAVGTLKSMFPEWDEETLTTLLMSNQYHVERTIETILSMCGDADAGVVEPAAPAPSHVVQSTAINAPAPAASYPPSSGHSRSSQPVSAPPPPDSRYRGVKSILPDDFLRPPGFQSRIYADEELALMLQNEMFMREARQVLGPDYDFSAHQQGRQPRSNQPNDPNRSRTVSRAVSGDGNDPTANPDLGIMKALSSMGSAAKTRLGALATRFRTGNQPTRNGETGNSREFRPLVDGNDEEDDIVSFDSSRGNRSQHVLQQQDDSPRDVDSENPLLMGGSRNVNVNTKRDI
jgi:hypothetical protein